MFEYIFYTGIEFTLNRIVIKLFIYSAKVLKYLYYVWLLFSIY